METNENYTPSGSFAVNKG